jgi:ABC-type Fe3+-hydroxamate transport system substrate-binding protein
MPIPKRIVSLVPSLTETLFKLGIGDRIVGVTDYCLEPPAETRARPKIGGPKTVDVDGVVAMAPDLVVAAFEENRKNHVQAIRRAGIRVFVSSVTSVRGAIEVIEELGRLTGARAEAERMASATRDALRWAEAKARQPRIRVFCPVWRHPYRSFGPATYGHDLLTRCGAANVFDDAADRYPVVTLREVEGRRPELLLLPDEPYPFARAHVNDFERAGIRARTQFIDGRIVSWYGARTAKSLVQLVTLLKQDEPRIA